MMAVAATCAALVVSYVRYETKRVRDRDEAIFSTQSHAGPIIRAIEQYKQDNDGNPPQELSGLVPKYLVRIPPPGRLADGDWLYWAADERSMAKGEWTLSVDAAKKWGPDNSLHLGNVLKYSPADGWTYKMDF